MGQLPAGDHRAGRAPTRRYALPVARRVQPIDRAQTRYSGALAVASDRLSDRHWVTHVPRDQGQGRCHGPGCTVTVSPW